MDRAVAWVTGKPAPVVIHALGCIPAYYALNRDDFKGLQAVVASGERVIVADDEFTARLLLPLYCRRILLLADTPEGSRRLGARLASQRLGSLLVVTRWSDTPIDLAPFREWKTRTARTHDPSVPGTVTREE